MKQTNKQEQQPFLSVDYRLLALDLKIEMDGKAKKEETILKTKLVYAYLLGLSKSCDEVYPVHQTIAKKLGIGSRQVAGRCIATLETLGWITKVPRIGTSNLYMVKSLEEILKSSQILDVIKDEVKEELESLETKFEDIIKSKSSFAEELDKESRVQELLINHTSFNRSQNKMPGFTIPDDEDQCPF